MKSILVPVDFSPPAFKALEYAVELAKQFDAKVTIIHVLETLAVPEFAAYPIIPEVDRIDKAKENLVALASEHGCTPEMIETMKVRIGVPFREITRAADSLKADLIVIATHGYSGLTHVLLGSTAERVVRHANCPVLVVPVRSAK